MKVKRKIIYILILLIALLLIVNLILDSVSKQKENKYGNSVSKNEIERKFKDVLLNFNISKDWIKVGKLKKKEGRSNNTYYKVSIPNGISIPNILKDINKAVRDENIRVKSKEKRNYGDSDIEIYENNVLKLKAKLFYSSVLNRENSTISFIVTGISGLNNDKVNELLAVPLNFGLVLIPGKFSENLLPSIKEHQKRFYLLLNEDIDDERFELLEDFTKGVLRRKINNMFKFFKGSSFFLVDQHSSLYKSTIFDYIRNVLKRNNKKIYYINSFTQLHGESNKDLKSLFAFYLKNIKPGTEKIFVISAANFLDLLDDILQYKKKGNNIKFAVFHLNKIRN